VYYLHNDEFGQERGKETERKNEKETTMKGRKGQTTKEKRNKHWLWATGWTIWVLGFDSLRGLGIFLFTTASRTALGPTQPPIQCVTGTLSLGVKWPGRETDHSPPSSAEVKE
jgi:hypothetical protein